MNPSPRERLASLLEREFGEPAFAAVRDAESDLLELTVTGVGPVKFPVTPTQARKLRALGAPARYGLGEQTLTDASVRDTWEIPQRSVDIRWAPGFEPLLDGVREELGLSSSYRLRAEFHSLLVYERGQFFLPHQDSEKDDAMVGTLVVTLPSRHTGGDLVIEKDGRKVECRGRDAKLVLAAFYADCRHEVRPVKTGTRITATFNLLLDGAAGQSAGGRDGAVETVVRCLTDHFTTPTAKPFSRSPAAAPDRLVYLLDHEYTERGLSWDRLKGGDAARAGLLRAAAENAGCRIMLASTEIKETWDAYPEEPRGGRGRRRYYDWDEEEADVDEGYDGAYELNDLVDGETRLVRWIDLDGKAEKITLDVDDDEVCSGTATAELPPYEQQYEGYMGNYGNTLDRWYRRAALVLFPADREFANRAEASPAWAMTQIGRRARAGDLPGARADAADLAPFWAASVRQGPQPGALGKSLSTVYALDDAATAAMLLEPFRAEHLRADAGAPLARLAERYGTAWTAEVLRGWFDGNDRPFHAGYGAERLAWYAELPELGVALTAAGEPGRTTARTLTELSWRRLLNEVRGPLAASAPSRRKTGLDELGEPSAAVLRTAETCLTPPARDQIVRQLAALGETATGWLLAALRAAAAAPDGPPCGRVFEALANEAASRLDTRLARPARAAGDWSIAAPAGCACNLCDILAEFLKDPKRRMHEWPLKEQDRRHVHSRIDSAELPVSHETRRQGRPYTLVLAKLDKLFDSERAERNGDAADLRWLGAVWPGAGRSTATQRQN